jgi:alanine racemase
MSGALLSIDLDALAANYRLLRDMSGAAEIAPVVKADGYGMGAGPVALRLWAEGARTFYVARLAEGQALRSALGQRPARILVFDGIAPGEASALVAADLIPVLNSPEQIDLWIQTCSAPRPTALQIDTGMNRLGLSLAESAALSGDQVRMRDLAPCLILSHLACAATPAHPLNRLQLERFRGIRTLFPAIPASLSSSAGIFLGPEYLFDQVRPGISLYGGGPHDRPEPRLAAVARLEAPILQIRHVAAGDSIGYGADFVAQAPMRVAIVAAGYADGYPRAASPAGTVWLGVARHRLLGRISMDLIAIDVSQAPEARAGDRVQMMGPDLPLDEVAAAAGGSAYELLVRIGRRSDRQWTGRS